MRVENVIPANDEEGARLVRCLWVEHVSTRTEKKQTHLVPYDDPAFPEIERQADRYIYRGVARPYQARICELKREIDCLRQLLLPQRKGS